MNQGDGKDFLDTFDKRKDAAVFSVLFYSMKGIPTNVSPIIITGNEP